MTEGKEDLSGEIDNVGVEEETLRGAEDESIEASDGEDGAPKDESNEEEEVKEEVKGGKLSRLRDT